MRRPTTGSGSILVSDLTLLHSSQLQYVVIALYNTVFKGALLITQEANCSVMLDFSGYKCKVMAVPKVEVFRNFASSLSSTVSLFSRPSLAWALEFARTQRKGLLQKK